MMTLSELKKVHAETSATKDAMADAMNELTLERKHQILIFADRLAFFSQKICGGDIGLAIAGMNLVATALAEEKLKTEIDKMQAAEN